MQRALAVLMTLAVVALAQSASAQTGRVQGVVLDTSGKGVRGATIRAFNPSAPAELTSATDDKGRFGLLGLRNGEWLFTAEAPGFEPATVRAPVRLATLGPPLRFVLRPTIAPIPGALPDDIAQQIDNANALRERGQFEQATAAYQALQSRNPKVTAFHVVLGDLYRQQAERAADQANQRALFDRAIAAYGEALKGDEPILRARLEMGLVQLQAGRTDDGVRTLQDVVSSMPGTAAGRAAADRLAALRR